MMVGSPRAGAGAGAGKSRAASMVFVGIGSFIFGLILFFAKEAALGGGGGETTSRECEELRARQRKLAAEAAVAAVPAVGGQEDVPYQPHLDVVTGLFRYPGSGHRREMTTFVDTLRGSGYQGRIVIFCHPGLLANPAPPDISSFLKYFLDNDVELVPVTTVPCQFHYKTGDTLEIRKVCVEDYPTLPMEYARFALARDWLKTQDLTGWALITDIRDTYFQRPPFEDMGDPNGKPRAYVYEEFFGVKGEKRKQTEGKQRGIDTSHWFAGLASKCYGREGVKPYEGKPMLCSGQLSGNRAGLMKVLTQYIDEMHKNVQKGPQCVTPEMPDQPLLNYMVYQKMLDIEVVPYGHGSVMTVGGTCTTHDGKRGLLDEIQFDDSGFLLDYEGRRAPVVHQYDRCA